MNKKTNKIKRTKRRRNLKKNRKTFKKGGINWKTPLVAASLLSPAASFSAPPSKAVFKRPGIITPSGSIPPPKLPVRIGKIAYFEGPDRPDNKDGFKVAVKDLNNPLDRANDSMSKAQTHEELLKFLESSHK